MTTDRLRVTQNLKSWARGMYCTEAAVMILIRAFDGRFARPGWPWIATSTYDGSFYVNADRMSDDDIGMLSGGEQRTLAIARSLLGSEPVDLSEAMTGLDRPTGHAVIVALTHATGTQSQDTGYRSTSARRDRQPHSVGIER